MDEMLSLLARVEPAPLALFLFWVVAHFFAEPLRWRCYRRDADGRGAAPYFQIFFLCAFVSLTAPLKLGLPARAALLRWKAHLDFTTITALMALDGMLYYGGWALSALAAVVWLSYAGDWQSLGWTLLALSVLVALALVLRRRRRLQEGAAEVPGDKWARRWRDLRGVCAALRPRVLLLAALIVAADIFTQVMRHDALLAMFGDHLPRPQLFAIVALSFFAGLASLMPLGLGGYDVTLVYLLVQAGVPAHAGVAIVVANRLGSVAVSAVLGSWGGWMLGVSPLRTAWLRKEAGKETQG